ncbi:hypothetical protein EVAR_57071_1 [Eumeta japonica]|uniref:Uncharacterized protein n=1 Tax=Eumeta variegata TaxID=151549 RepID=A0A4C1Y6I7_EUMVA|nr:hypothetical protein EVAR_57071_1 [Eumeta japonica]
MSRKRRLRTARWKLQRPPDRTANKRRAPTSERVYKLLFQTPYFGAESAGRVLGLSLHRIVCVKESVLLYMHVGTGHVHMHVLKHLPMANRLVMISSVRKINFFTQAFLNTSVRADAGLTRNVGGERASCREGAARLPAVLCAMRPFVRANDLTWLSADYHLPATNVCRLRCYTPRHGLLHSFFLWE